MPRTPRMPRIDELPLPAQNEIRAQRGELDDDHPEKRRMSLMQRLASVGLGPQSRSGGASSPAARLARRGRCRNSSVRLSVRLPATPEGRPAEPVSEYARRAAPQGLDTARPHRTCA